MNRIPLSLMIARAFQAAHLIPASYGQMNGFRSPSSNQVGIPTIAAFTPLCAGY